ncbi:MAG: hypothetical protein JXQ76_03185 [Campylobacterales bacterium]|nr:hypothetical protein [Campylobacterales bacterium]
MTTISLQINEDSQDFIYEIKKLIAQFQPKIKDFTISQNSTTQEEVLSNFTQLCQEIKNGETLQRARPIEELYKGECNPSSKGHLGNAHRL